MKKLLTLLAILVYTGFAYATTPTISNVTGTLSKGQTLTITGTNMVNENSANWDSYLKSISGMYGFESTSFPLNGTTMGWYHSSASSEEPTIDTTVKLAGNKSMKFHVAGGNTGSSNDGASTISWNGSEENPNYYFRYYSRWSAVNDIFPNVFTKSIMSCCGTNNWYFELAGAPSTVPINWYAMWGATATPPIAGGGLVPNRWYLIEGAWTNSPTKSMKVWVDNVLTLDVNPSLGFSNNWPNVGIINYKTNGNKIDLTNWVDNFAFGSTGRIYPSSLIEISGDNGLTWTYQPPVSVGSNAALSDTQITVSADLPTLTAANYLLRVTNNQQQTSLTFTLGSGGGATATAPQVNGACGTASGQSFTSLTSSSPNLCSTGTVTSFAGSGPWSWGCSGSGGGTSTSSTACYASLATSSSTLPTSSTLLFSESFENNSYAARGWYDNTNQGTIVSGGQSGNCLQWAWASGASTPTNGGSTRMKFTPSDSLYVSYYVKFQTGWRGSEVTYHPHMIYILSDLDSTANTYSPLANNYLNTYLEFLSDTSSPYAIRPQIAIQDEKRVNTSYGTPPNNLSAITENRSVAYCNTPVSTGASGTCYADAPYYSANTWTAPAASLSTNVWHKVEVYLKMNTIINGKGQSNGIMQEWIDDALVLNHSDVLYRTNQDANKKWAQFVLAPYMAPPSGGSPIAQTMWIDELKVMTAPPTGVPVTTPSGLIIKSITP